MKELNIKIYDKLIPTTFVTLGGIEFDIRELCSTISKLLNTEEYDNGYGEYSLRDYEINVDVAKKLVELDLAKHFIGSRMARLYCVKNKEKLEKLLDELYDIWQNFEDEKSKEK